MNDISKVERKKKIIPWYIEKHKEIVELLDQNPDWWDLRTKQKKRAALMALKPMIYELWRTKQLTRKEIVAAIQSTGYKVSETEIKYVIERMAWKYNEKEGAIYNARKRWTHENSVDAGILEIAREMPPHKMDPRVACRYYEIINAVPVQTNANFFRSVDMLCAMERKAREAWSMDQTLEEHIHFNGTEVPEGIKDDAEIMQWVRFI